MDGRGGAKRESKPPTDECVVHVAYGIIDTIESFRVFLSKVSGCYLSLGVQAFQVTTTAQSEAIARRLESKYMKRRKRRAHIFCH